MTDNKTIIQIPEASINDILISSKCVQSALNILNESINTGFNPGIEGANFYNLFSSKRYYQRF